MTKKLPLSPMERKAYKFIKAYLTKHDYPPTRVEIAKELKMKKYGRQFAHNLLVAIEAKGYIKLGKGWRNIEIINERIKVL